MNKQIRLLAEQAGVEHTQNCGIEQYYFEHDELAKFAELIVRECANLCKHEWDGDADTFLASEAYNECAEAIKQHFGVEE